MTSKAEARERKAEIVKPSRPGARSNADLLAAETFARGLFPILSGSPKSYCAKVKSRTPRGDNPGDQTIGVPADSCILRSPTRPFAPGPLTSTFLPILSGSAGYRSSDPFARERKRSVSRRGGSRE